MLVLSRKLGEQIRIGDQITVTVLRIQGQSIRIGINAPADVAIIRQELMPVDPIPRGTGIASDKSQLTSRDHA